MVRGKFRFSGKNESYYRNTDGSLHQFPPRLIFEAVYDDGIEENKRFAKATPSGRLEITIDNPSAADYFEQGKAYYLDLTAAE